jgi:hypothetical protein
MALRTVLGVDVDDSQFVAFQNRFERYQRQLASQPEIWQAAGDAATESFGKIGAALLAQQDIMRENEQTANRAATQIHTASSGMGTLAGHARTFAGHIARAASSFDDVIGMAGGLLGAGAVAVKATGGAIKGLAPWIGMLGGGLLGGGLGLLEGGVGAIPGAIGGAGLGEKIGSWIGKALGATIKGGAEVAGGILAAGIGTLTTFDRYATSAGGELRDAQGLGTSIARSGAFSTEYGRMVNPGAYMESVANSLTDVRQRGWLYGLGFTNRDLDLPGGGVADTTTVAKAALPRIWRLLHSRPESMLASTAQAYGLPFDQDTLRRIYETKYSDLGKYGEQFQKDVGKFGGDKFDLVAKKWQDFSIQLERAGKQIYATFGVGLVGALKPIGALTDDLTGAVAKFVGSKGFTAVVGDATGALQKMVDYLNGKTGGGGGGGGVGAPTAGDVGKSQVTPDVGGGLPNYVNKPLGGLLGDAAQKAWAWTKSEIPWETAEKWIEKFESGGKNVMNYINDASHTAGGYFQITNSTWHEFSRLVKGAEKYATAISAPFSVQEAVAKAIYEARGAGPWAAYDKPLAETLLNLRDEAKKSAPPEKHHLKAVIHDALKQHDAAKNPAPAPGLPKIDLPSMGSPNVQQPQPIHVIVHNNTGANVAVSSNAAAGGVH